MPSKKLAPKKQSSLKTVKKLVKKPVKKLVKKPVKKLVKKTVKKPVKKLVKKPVKKLVKKPAKKPVKKLVKKPVKKPVLKRKSKKVAPVPKGYHNLTPCLMVSNAVEAIEFYKKVFGAKEVMRFNGPNGKVGHAELLIGDSKLMLSDIGMSQNVTSSNISTHQNMNNTIHLYIKDVDKVIDKAIASGAKLIQAVEDKFYGDRSGMIMDPYGHQWSVSTHFEDLSVKEVNKRAQSFGRNLLELSVK